MEMIELKLNMIISENLHLNISLDRSMHHHLSRKYSTNPFINQNLYTLYIMRTEFIRQKCFSYEFNFIYYQ